MIIHHLQNDHCKDKLSMLTPMHKKNNQRFFEDMVAFFQMGVYMCNPVRRYTYQIYQILSHNVYIVSYLHLHKIFQKLKKKIFRF